MEMDLKQGTRVEFDIQFHKGKGTIVGVATNGSPIIGKSYIIEPDEKLKSDVYDYTHFVAWETQFVVIPSDIPNFPDEEYLDY
jgi:hypothetical protein